MIKSLIILNVFLLTIRCTLFSQNIDTTSKKFKIIVNSEDKPIILPLEVDDTAYNIYKVAGSTFYHAHSPVTLIDDSLLFDGFLVFEAHKYIDGKFHDYDSTFYQFEIFILNDLINIKDTAKRIFDDENLDYYYADEKGVGYDTGTEKNKNRGEVIITDNMRESYNKFRKFYSKYLEISRYSNEKYFMMKVMRTSIFKNPEVYFWKYDSDSISYFIFRCSFYTAVLKYDVYYISDKHERIFLKDCLFFLPVSKSLLFEPVDKNKMIEAGFSKSEWYPQDLFYKHKMNDHK